MLKRNLGVLVALLFVATGVQAVQAQTMKVGYISDHELIIAAMPEYQTIRQQLQQELQNSQEALQSMSIDFQDKVDKYQKQQPLLSEARRAEREQELLQLQQELQQAAATSEQNLAQREVELLSPLYDRADAAINKVAKEKGLHMVLRSRIAAQPILVYVDEEMIMDITLDVATELGIEIPDEEEGGETASSDG